MQIRINMQGRYEVVREFNDISIVVELFNRIDDAKRFVKYFWGAI